jgi:hypothetical protein
MAPLGQTRAYERGEVGRRAWVNREGAGVGGTGEAALVAQQAEDETALRERREHAIAVGALDQGEQLGIQARYREDVGEGVVRGAEDDVAARGEIAESGRGEPLVEAGHVR